MRTGQRDVHNTPLKRRLSITYEELETLKKSIKVSVLNELRAEMENVSDQDSIKDLVLSEIRTELMGIPNPALLKASILNELRTELKASGENDSEAADRKLREIAGIQDGLVRELLDQKMLIKKLETQIGDLAKQLEDAKRNAAPVAPPSVVTSSPSVVTSSPSVVTSSPSVVTSPSIVPSSVTLTLPEDPLDLPPLSRKTNPRPEQLSKEKPAYRLGQFKEAPASLPGTGVKVQLKLREVEPADLDREIAETKCEYIIAASGDKRGLRGIVRQGPSVREPARQQHPIKTQLRQQPPEPSLPERQPSAIKTGPVETKPAEGYKCEYIIAERPSKKHFIEESVDVRENEDAEVITCSRKSSRMK